MISRRGFIGAGSALLAVAGCATAGKKKDEMQGFEERDAGKLPDTRCAAASRRRSTRRSAACMRTCRRSRAARR